MKTEKRDRRTLPDEVLARFEEGEKQNDIWTRQGLDIVEHRLQKIELRADEGEGGAAEFRLEGYATTYESEYRVGGVYGWDEVIGSGACAKSIAEKDDVRFLVNHSGVPIARTKSGTLELVSDDTGLLVRTGPLDMSNPTVVELVSALQRGDIDEMSFAFEVLKQEWSPDYEQRRITELRLFDVSGVTYPANPATAIKISERSEERSGISLALALAQQDVD